MFNTVIWATDGSEHADEALAFATKLVDRTDGRIIGVHVRELLVGRAGGQPVYADEEAVIGRLHDRANDLRVQGYAVDVQVVTSFDVNAAHAIAEIAREREADVIVVGTRGRGVLATALLGSVTQKLLHEVDCPVFAVPPHVRVQEPSLA